ncbi:MAG: hypothetical protein IJ358_02190 [Clostridia bacterium]|nr:hypothetical protein [Clostridia bacterium]
MYISKLSSEELIEFILVKVGKQYHGGEMTVAGLVGTKNRRTITIELRKKDKLKGIVKGIFTDFSCDIEDKNMLANTTTTYDKDYASWVYKKLRASELIEGGKKISAEYKKAYNEHRKLVMQKEIEESAKRIQEECEQTLLK